MEIWTASYKRIPVRLLRHMIVELNSHRSHRKAYNIPLVELHNFPNDLLTDSPHMGHAKDAPLAFDNHGGSRSSKKRSLEDSQVKVTLCAR
jgi:hypothetical protein